MFASDRDRERAANALREHYARGRLSLEELTARVERAVKARSRADVRSSVAGLPLVPDPQALVRQGRSFVVTAARGILVLALTAVYLLFTLVLVVVVPLVLLIRGVSASELVALLVIWLVPTYLVSRLWFRGGRAAL